MATRTYLPSLIALVRTLCVYTTRYDSTIREFVPTNALTAYAAMKSACDLFLELVPPAPELP